MKKEYLILIALIVGLSAYLGLKKDDQVHYELPVLAALDTKELDRVDITQNKETFTLLKSDKGWTVTEESFPVDQAAIDSVLDTIKDLKLSALVSEAGDKIRYELDTARAIQVTAWAGETEKRVFVIGKTAPSFNHTFVMLNDGNNIYQADKSFRNNFDKTIDEFRDKLVLSFETETVKKITLEKSGIVRTLVLSTPAPPKEGEADAEKTKEPSGTWQFEDGTTADETAAQDLLSSLSHLECQGYLKTPETKDLEKEKTLYKISLENGANLSLSLFEQADGETMAGQSSSTPYAFTIDSYKAKDIVSYVDKLLGLDQKEEATSE